MHQKHNSGYFRGIDPILPFAAGDRELRPVHLGHFAFIGATFGSTTIVQRMPRIDLQNRVTLNLCDRRSGIELGRLRSPILLIAPLPRGAILLLFDPARFSAMQI